MSDQFQLDLFHEKLKKYDYIRLSSCDLLGHKRGKLVPSREMGKFLSGIGIFAGALYFGPRDEIGLETLKTILADGAQSAILVPDPKTLHDVKWAGGEKYNIGEVFGQIYWENPFTPQAACPRQMVLEQLSKLENLGYELFSGYEMEFKITNQDDSPLPGFSYCSNDLLSQYESLLMDIETNLHAANVSIETIHTEYSEGQFEFVLKPFMGVTPADQVFISKHGLKEMCREQNMRANFMSKPHIKGCGSGLHYNHSLWDIKSKKNIFFDPEGDMNLSEVARYWLGGLMKHAKSLSIVFSPSVNCYRRLHQPWAPGKVDWGLGNRFACFRVKNNGQNGSYMENRIPSGLSNPYLVMAATIAAGIDGIENKIEPPNEMSENADLLPSTLQEAIDALESNEIIKKALGEEFCQYFISLKGEIELKTLCDHDMTTSDSEQIKSESEEYFWL